MATHNQPSIEHTVARMGDLGLDPPGEQGVFFGQLLGMADQLTFTLGRSGYRVSFAAIRACPHASDAVTASFATSSSYWSHAIIDFMTTGRSSLAARYHCGG